MKDYHLAWLLSHPHRSCDWLEDRLKDGFDIHHIDGDHSNNDPTNLILIEHADHMRLHGLTNSARLRSFKAGPKRTTILAGQDAYWSKVEGKTWRELGHKKIYAAKVYAKHMGEKWPIKPTVAV